MLESIGCSLCYMRPVELLSNVMGQLGAYRKAKALYAERLAPDFSPLEFLDTRENGLSRIFAWLLDPQGNHAQGDRFAVAFLAWLGLDHEWTAPLARARVLTEAATTADGRSGYIDVLMRMPDRAVAIENKPYAVDQPFQIERYLDALRATYADRHCLLYLSSDGSPPSPESIGLERRKLEVERGSLVIRGFAQLTAWLDVCVTVCRAPSVVHMLESLTRHIRNEFMDVTDVDQAAELAKEIVGAPGMLEPALAVLEAASSIRSLLFAKTLKVVQEEATKRKGWHVFRSDLGARKHSAITINLDPASSISFGIQFDQANHGYLFYGAHSADARTLPPKVKNVLQGLLATTTGTDYWPAWKRVGPNDNFFPLSQQVDADFWMAANDGRLALMIVEFVEAVSQTLSSADLLDAVLARRIS